MQTIVNAYRLQVQARIKDGLDKLDHRRRLCNAVLELQTAVDPHGRNVLLTALPIDKVADNGQKIEAVKISIIFNKIKLPARPYAPPHYRECLGKQLDPIEVTNDGCYWVGFDSNGDHINHNFDDICAMVGAWVADQVCTHLPHTVS